MIQLSSTSRAPGGCSRLCCALLTVLSALYLGAVLVIQRSYPESFVLTHLLTHAPQPLLLLPLAPALFFALIFWRPRQVLLNLALIILAVMVLMPPSFPARRVGRASRPPALGGRIRLVTWNVYEDFARLPDMAAAVAPLQPDIVCLQEARRDTFAQILPGGDAAHTHEVTTVTRGRIISERELRLGPRPNYRWALETVIDLPQGRLTVLNVHFLASFSARTLRHHRDDFRTEIARTEQARRLERDTVLQWLARTSGPRVVAGDFNSPPGTAIYRSLAAAAVDAFAAQGLGWGFTYRRDHPLLRLDHIFCGDGVTPLRAFTRDGHVSDHRLVVADIILNPQP